MNDRRARVWSFIYRSTTAVLERLPFWFVSPLGDAAGYFVWLLAKKAREPVRENLRHVLGEDVAPQVLEHTVRAAFCSYGRYWTELAWSTRGGKRLERLQLDLSDAPQADKLSATEKGVIFALPHVGAWDVAGALFVRKRVPLTTVAEGAISSELFEWFVEKREKLGLSVLAIDSHTATRLLQVLRDDQSIALLADRDVVGDGVKVTMFGTPTRAPGGPALLSLRSGVPIVPLAVYQDGRGRYRTVTRPAIVPVAQGRLREDVARLTQQVVSELEVLISLAPEQWHVFGRHWPSATKDTERG